MTTMKMSRAETSNGQVWLAAGFAAIGILGLAAAMERLPFLPVDWFLYEKVLHNPLEPYQFNYFNPPWTIWLLLPLSAFTYQAGMLRLLTLIVFLALLRSRGGDLVSAVLLATSAPMLFLIANGNIEFLPALGLLIPAREIGLIFLLTKPQAGILATLAWVRSSGGQRLWLLPLPALAVFLISLVVYGWWPAEVVSNIIHMKAVGLTHVEWNTALFPWSIPAGLYFLWRTWRDADEYHGVTATWLLSPYLPLYTLTIWLALFLAREKRRWIVVPVWLLLWVVYLWRFQGWMFA